MATPGLSVEEVAPLQLLLKAQSKAIVVNVCRETFLHRNGKVPDMVMASTAKTLDIQPSEASKLFSALMVLVKTVLYEGLTDTSSISALFPGDFHKNLKGLLSDIMAKNISEWRTQALNDQVSLPRLVNFDWRVDVKTSSDSAARMAQPTCIVQMKVEDNPQHRNQMPAVRSVNVEFSRETLDTMLDGLGKIRDQLSSVSKS